MKKRLFLLLAVLLPLGAAAQTFTATTPSGHNVTCIHESGMADGTVRIGKTGTDTYTGDLTIASTVEYNGTTYNVAKLSDFAFYQCTELTSVTVQGDIATGTNAFQGCTGLLSADLSECTAVGDNTFGGCSSLTTVDLAGCTTVGNGAFNYCSSLASVSLPACTSIGSNAFKYCTSLASASFPVCTSLDYGAFMNCSALESVNLPSTLVTIGGYAFSGCPARVVSVPDGVESIGDNAFNNVWLLYYNGSATGSPWGAKYVNGVVQEGLTISLCDDGTWRLDVGAGVSSLPNFSSSERLIDVALLSHIEVDAANSSFSSIDGVLYTKNKKELTRVPAARSGNLTIGVGVTSIDQKAFNGCGSIDTLFFNASACAPKGAAPSFASGKKYVGGLWDYDTYIIIWRYTSGIFDTLTRVNVLEVGDEVDTLYYTIASLPGVKSINVSADNWKYHSLDGMLVNEAGNTVLRCPVGREGAFAFPDGISRVAAGAFAFCRRITSLDLEPISFIGTTTNSSPNGAFAHCTGLRTLTVPAGLDTLGSSAFAGNWLDTLFYNAPDAYHHIDSVKVGMYGIGYCTSVFGSDSLRAVVVGDGVTALPEGAFCHSKALQGVQLPDGLVTIGAGAFGDCPLLARIDIPSSVRAVGLAAFSGCMLLDSIVLPDSLRYMGHSLFHNCISLGEITIPPAVTAIGGSAFRKCTGLKRIYYNAVSCALSLNFGSDSTKYSYQMGGSPLLFGNKTETSDVSVDHLIVGEGVRSMAPVWATCVDTLTLPSTLDTVVMMRRSMFGEGSLRQVYFNCRNLRLVYDYYTSDSISPVSLFGKCANLRHVEFGDSVQTVPTYCFHGCDQVREFVDLELPATLTALGSGAFENCTQIESAVIPAGLTEVGASPFLGCKKLKHVTYNVQEADYYGDLNLPNLDRNYIPNSALSYDNVAKFNARQTKAALADLLPPVDTITIGPGVRTIAPCFFGYPWNQMLDTTEYVRMVYVDNQSTSLRSIGNGAFANLNLSNARSLFTDSLQFIDQAAFMNATGIGSVHLAEGCQYVGAGAFRNCQDLDSLWLPSSLQWLGTDAFLLDSALSYLYFDCDSLGIDHVEPTSCTPFGNTVSLHSIDFGTHVRYLTDGMFYNAEGLERLELPEGLLGVGEKCFYMQVSDSKKDAVATSSAPTTAAEHVPVPLTVTFIVSGYVTSSVDTVRLHYVSFPSTIQSIGSYAFRQGGAANHYILNPTSHLDTIVCHATTPIELGSLTMANNLFDDVWYNSSQYVFEDSTYADATLIVPCGSKSAYENYSQLMPVADPAGGYYAYKGKFYYYDYTWEAGHPAWSDFQHIEEFMPYSLQLTVNVDTMGSASSECGDSGVVLTATPAASHRFLQWSDGVEDNPRTVVLTADTAFEARFAWGLLYDIAVVSGNTARGSATGGGTYIQDTVVTLTATPLYGYHFSHWSDGDTTNPRQYTVAADATLTAVFMPNQYTLAVDCDAEQGTVSGGGSYDYNTAHSISATAATGYHFTQWSDGVATNPRSVTLTGDTSFTALFAINSYTLVLECDETAGSVSGGGDYEHGTQVTVEATPATGHHFTQWSDGATDNPYTFTLTGDLALTASFALNRYAVGAQAGEGGTATATADSADYGTTVTFTATAHTGHHFAAWQDGDSANPRTVTVVSDTVLTATFERNSYTVKLLCDAAQGSTSGDGTYLYGDTATLAATAAAHWHFSQWDDGNTQNPRQLVVTEDKTLTAQFAEDMYTLTVNSANPQQGTANGGGKYAYGTDATLTANPKQGFHFDHWQDGNADNPRTVTVVSDTLFTAHFEADDPDNPDPEGIESVYAEAGVGVEVLHGRIVVSGAEGRTVRLFDAVGRRIASLDAPLPQGVYLLQVEGLPARRLVVVGR